LTTAWAVIGVATIAVTAVLLHDMPWALSKGNLVPVAVATGIAALLMFFRVTGETKKKEGVSWTTVVLVLLITSIIIVGMVPE
jgi:heme/copper-type cytochrome/quinol oxidase subunit 4